MITRVSDPRLLLLKRFCVADLWGLSPLEVSWHIRNVGQVLLILVMSRAIWNSDWDKLAQEAAEYAEDDSEEAGAGAVKWTSLKTHVTEGHGPFFKPTRASVHHHLKERHMRGWGELRRQVVASSSARETRPYKTSFPQIILC